MYFLFFDLSPGGGMGQGAWTEFAVVVGCILFHMHFSQSKNALLLNYGLQNLMCIAYNFKYTSKMP